MKRINEEVPGFDEIIFENRNKEYGAYDIRKHYLPATLWSVVVTIALLGILTGALSLLSEKDAAAGSDGPIIVVVKTDPAITDPNKLKPSEPEKPAGKPQLKVIGPPVITDDPSAITTMLPNDQLIDSVKNRPVIPDDTLEFDPDQVFGTEPEPAVFVEEMPVFPGGAAGLMKFIGENILYPEEAVSNGVEGRVVMRFVVTTDGTVNRIEVYKGVHPVLDQEALRVIAKMPKWKPGRQNGVPAAVWFTVPVTFILERK